MIVNGADFSNKNETGFYNPALDDWLEGPDYPPWRKYASLVWDNDHKLALLYGGTKDGGNSGTTNELWAYNPQNGTWLKLPNTGAPALYCHAAVWDPVNHQMIVSGGLDPIVGGHVATVYSMKFVHPSSAWLESSTFDTGGLAYINNVSYTLTNAPEGIGSTPIKVQIATSGASTPWDYIGPDGTSDSYYTDQAQYNVTTHAGDNNLRYKLLLETDEVAVAPELGELKIQYSRFKSFGRMDSTVFDTGLESPQILDASWDVENVGDSDLEVFVRSSANSDMSSPTGWRELYNEDSLKHLTFKRYLQYRLEMTSENRCFTPRVSRVTFNLNARPSVQLPVLYPSIGNLSTIFKYSINYKDPDGSTPPDAYLLLDGKSEELTATENGTLKDGLEYVYETTLFCGDHKYEFYFWDGYAEAMLPVDGEFDGPSVYGVPTLSEPSVTPQTGIPTDTFCYSVIYEDPEGLSPATANLIIDEGEPIAMENHGSDGPRSWNYKLYTTLSEGSHTYRFEFSDDQYNISLPVSGVFKGPDVAEAPKITEVVPDDGDEDVPVTTELNITFSEPMNETTLTSATILLKDANNVPVSGTLQYLPETYLANFKPDSELEYKTIYFATVKKAVTDLAGNGMVEDYRWAFTTIEYQEDIGEGEDNDNDGIPNDKDDDDDNDGYLDIWEIFLGTDANNTGDRPLDTDNDGQPDGDAINSEKWMDRDDDGDSYTDSKETEFGTNPKDSNSNPATEPGNTGEGEPEQQEESLDWLWGVVGLIVVIVVFMMVYLFVSKPKSKPKAPISQTHPRQPQAPPQYMPYPQPPPRPPLQPQVQPHPPPMPPPPTSMPPPPPPLHPPKPMPQPQIIARPPRPQPVPLLPPPEPPDTPPPTPKIINQNP
jgi:hypothetical protein